MYRSTYRNKVEAAIPKQNPLFFEKRHRMPGWRALHAAGPPWKGAEGAAFGGPHGGFARGGLQDAGPSSLACSASFLPGNGGKIHAECIPISTAGSDSAAHVTYSRRRGMQEPRMTLMRHGAYYSNRSNLF